MKKVRKKKGKKAKQGQEEDRKRKKIKTQVEEREKKSPVIDRLLPVSTTPNYLACFIVPCLEWVILVRLESSLDFLTFFCLHFIFISPILIIYFFPFVCDILIVLNLLPFFFFSFLFCVVVIISSSSHLCFTLCIFSISRLLYISAYLPLSLFSLLTTVLL